MPPLRPLAHQPLDDRDDLLRIVHPGSPTDRRRQRHGTLAVLDVSAGRVRRLRILPVT
ncbi:MAG: hypothetical protein ACR2JQ_09720 [Mycobacteriales bacterium]